jgi:hypothetical protein
MINGQIARPNLLNLGYKSFILTNPAIHCVGSLELPLNQATAIKALRLLECLGKATPSHYGKFLQASAPGNATLATTTTTEISNPKPNPSATKAANQTLPKTISKAPDLLRAALDRGIYLRLKVFELGHPHPLAYPVQTAANATKFYLAYHSAGVGSLNSATSQRNAVKLGPAFCTRHLVGVLEYVEKPLARRPNYSTLLRTRARTNQSEDNLI